MGSNRVELSCSSRVEFIELEAGDSEEFELSGGLKLWLYLQNCELAHGIANFAVKN